MCRYARPRADAHDVTANAWCSGGLAGALFHVEHRIAPAAEAPDRRSAEGCGERATSTASGGRPDHDGLRSHPAAGGDPGLTPVYRRTVCRSRRRGGAIERLTHEGCACFT